MRDFARALPVVLGGYALFDRAFAYVSVPGIPVYLGEALVGASVLIMIVATPVLRRRLPANLPQAILLLFICWGAARTVTKIGDYGVNSFRDASLWYYAILAFMVAALVTSPGTLEDWARRYNRFLPWLLVWGICAVVLAKQPQPVVPGTDISIFSHKPDDISTHATIALAFLWLVPHGRSLRSRFLLTALAVLTIVIVGTQTRGGLVAAAAGLAIIVLMGRHSLRLVGCMLVTLLLAVALAWSLDVRVATNYPGRKISVDQFLANFASLSQDNNSTQLGGNVEWRNELWSDVLQKTRENNKLVVGWGFGPNLAELMGFTHVGEERPLRSPHNSHIDILARMGIIGAVLWGALWLSWYGFLIRGYRRLHGLKHRVHRGAIVVAITGVTAILVQAYFDPALESPPAAIWLWALVGIGIGAASITRVDLEPDRSATSVPLARFGRAHALSAIEPGAVDRTR